MPALLAPYIQESILLEPEAPGLIADNRSPSEFSLQGSDIFTQEIKGTVIHPAQIALNFNKDESFASYGPEDSKRSLRNFGTSAFAKKSPLLEYQSSQSSCCCEVEEVESHVAQIKQLTSVSKRKATQDIPINQTTPTPRSTPTLRSQQTNQPTAQRSLETMQPIHIYAHEINININLQTQSTIHGIDPYRSRSS